MFFTGFTYVHKIRFKDSGPAGAKKVICTSLVMSSHVGAAGKLVEQVAGVKCIF